MIHVVVQLPLDGLYCRGFFICFTFVKTKKTMEINFLTTPEVRTGLIVTILIFAFHIAKKLSTMPTAQEFQDTIDATNKALDNVATEMNGLKAEIVSLQTQVSNMGLTADQETAIAASLNGLRTRAEAISTVVEGAPAETPETPAEEGNGNNEPETESGSDAE